MSIKPAKFVLTGRMVHGRCAGTSHTNRHNPTCARKIALRVAVKLTAPARLTITIKRALAGRQVGGRCVKATHKNTHARPCTRLVPLPGTLTRSANAGPSTFIFNGRIGGHALGAGTYRLSLTASAAGQTASPRTVRFQLLGAS